MKRSLLLLGFLPLFWIGCSSAPPPKPKPAAKPAEVNVDANRDFFADSAFSNEFVRVLGASVWQGADIRECLDTSKLIKKGDFESWFSAWSALADRTRSSAGKPLARNHQVSAFHALLRASNYYRAAEHFLHGNPSDSRIASAWKSNHDAFAKAISHLNISITPVKIPYEKKMDLPGYLYRADQKRKPRPLLILQNGWDGEQESLYGLAMEGVKRGYQVLTFDGPGQGSLLREKNIPMRVDWEFVMRPVVDYVLSLKFVDQNAIAYYGLGLGGYLAARGAGYEHRIQALIVNPGIYDGMDGLTKSAPPLSAVIPLLKTDPKEADDLIRAWMAKRTQYRYFIEQGMYVFQAKTPSAFLSQFAEVKMKDAVEMINTPTLVCDSETEAEGSVGQAQLLFDHLKVKRKTLLQFKMNEGGEVTQQEGSFLSSSQKVFDWLDEAFGI